MNKDITLEQVGLNPGPKLCWLIAWVALIVLVLGTALTYPFLPELVPQNFHADGSFRGESPRWQIWLLPIFATLLHWIMNWASKRPLEKSNIAHIDERTPAHVKARVQQLNQAMIWYLVALLNSYFAWVQSIYIGVATGWWPRMPSLTLWMVLLLSIGMIYYVAKILKASQEKAD